MRGIFVGLMVTAIASLVATSLTMTLGGSELLNFLASLCGTLVAIGFYLPL